MKTYEITYLTSNEETADAANVSGALAEAKAKIMSVNPWGPRRKLTYPIKKQEQAFFTTVVFEAEPTAIAALDRALHLQSAVLRSLIVEFVPGIFQQRETRTQEETAAPAKPSETKPVTPEGETAPASLVAEPQAETVTPLEAEAVKPKPRTRRKTVKAEEADAKSLDEKLDELLKEDITK